MQRYEESRKKARKWGWREGVFAQENDAMNYNLLTINMIHKSVFRINELISEQVNKLLLQSLLTCLLVTPRYSVTRYILVMVICWRGRGEKVYYNILYIIIIISILLFITFLYPFVFFRHQVCTDHQKCNV